MKYSLSHFGRLHGTMSLIMGEKLGEGIVLIDELACSILRWYPTHERALDMAPWARKRILALASDRKIGSIFATSLFFFHQRTARHVLSRILMIDHCLLHCRTNALRRQSR